MSVTTVSEPTTNSTEFDPIPDLYVDTRNLVTTIVRGANMQICHPLRCKQIDMSTADRLISIFRSNIGAPLLALRANASTLEFKPTSCTLNSLTNIGNYNKAIRIGFYPK